MTSETSNPIETAPKRARNAPPASFKLPWIVCDVFNALRAPQDKAEFAAAVFNYAQGKATELQENVLPFFEMARAQIDALKEEQARLSAVRKEIGARGGAKFAEICAKAREFEGNATPPKQTAPASQVATPAQNPFDVAQGVLDAEKARRAKHANKMANLRQNPAFREKENRRRREARAQRREARAKAKEAK